MRQRKRYSEARIRESKALGITPYEYGLWNVTFPADELVEATTPRRTLVPDGVRELVVAMIELVRDDLRLPTPTWAVPGTVYARDPYTARSWLEREDERPFSPRWCCAVLRIRDVDRLRRWLLARKDR